MQTQQLHEVEGPRTFAVVFGTGEEAKQGLTSFAVEHDVPGAALRAIEVSRASLTFHQQEGLPSSPASVHWRQ